MINIEDYSPEKENVEHADIVLKNWTEYLLLQAKASEKKEILKANKKLLLTSPQQMRSESFFLWFSVWKTLLPSEILAKVEEEYDFNEEKSDEIVSFLY